MKLSLNSIYVHLTQVAAVATQGPAPSLAHHDLGVAQHVLVAGRVQDDAAGVGVDAVDVQDTELPFLLRPLQHLHNTNPQQRRSVHHTGYHSTAKGNVLGKNSKEAASSSYSLHRPLHHGLEPQPVLLVWVNTSAEC